MVFLKPFRMKACQREDIWAQTLCGFHPFFFICINFNVCFFCYVVLCEAVSSNKRLPLYLLVNPLGKNWCWKSAEKPSAELHMFAVTRKCAFFLFIFFKGTFMPPQSLLFNMSLLPPPTPPFKSPLQPRCKLLPGSTHKNLKPVSRHQGCTSVPVHSFHYILPTASALSVKNGGLWKKTTFALLMG